MSSNGFIIITVYIMPHLTLDRYSQMALARLQQIAKILGHPIICRSELLLAIEHLAVSSIGIRNPSYTRLDRSSPLQFAVGVIAVYC